MNCISTDYMHFGLLINDNDTDVPLKKPIIMYYTHLWIDLLHRRAQRHMALMFQAQLNSNTARVTLISESSEKLQ